MEMEKFFKKTSRAITILEIALVLWIVKLLITISVTIASLLGIMKILG